MTNTFTVIRFTQVGRSGRQRQVWVSGVRFADGPGFKVKSVSFTTDRAQANRFSFAAASDIAAQYYTSPATLERPDGTPMAVETARLQAECLARNVQAIASREEIRREWAAFWGNMPADLRTSLQNVGVRF